jgi:hypothetical protein
MASREELIAAMEDPEGYEVRFGSHLIKVTAMGRNCALIEFDDGSEDGYGIATLTVTPKPKTRCVGCNMEIEERHGHWLDGNGGSFHRIIVEHSPSLEAEEGR